MFLSLRGRVIFFSKSEFRSVRPPPHAISQIFHNRQSKKKKLKSSQLKIIMALSTTDTICCREVEQDVITWALRLEEIQAIYFFLYVEALAVTKWSTARYGKEEKGHNTMISRVVMLKWYQGIFHIWQKRDLRNKLKSCHAWARWHVGLNQSSTDVFDRPNNLVGCLHSRSFHSLLFYLH